MVDRESEKFILDPGLPGLIAPTPTAPFDLVGPGTKRPGFGAGTRKGTGCKSGFKRVLGPGPLDPGLKDPAVDRA
jgi:hypothetical protein